MTDKERRIEQYIRAIIAVQDGTSPLPEYPAQPVWRLEEMLAAILSALRGDSPVLPCPDPVWVSPEGFLRALYDTLTGASPAWPCPQPTDRIGTFLKAICDGDECELSPVWDYPEALLSEWALAGSSKTYGPGDILTFDSPRAKKLKELTVTMSPIQDLHGYDSPWPAGGGKNKLPITATTTTVSDVTFTIEPDGTVKTSGVASSSINFVLNTTTKLVEGTSYKIGGCPEGGGNWTYYMRSTRGILTSNTGTTYGVEATATSEALYLFIHVESGIDMSGLTFHPMVVLSSETDSSWTPYENICPITGRTGASAYLGAEYDPDTATLYSVQFTDGDDPLTVYSGTVDIVTGEMRVTHGIYTFTGTETYVQQTGAVAIKTPIVVGSNSALNLPVYCSDFEARGSGATNFLYITTSMPSTDVQTYMANNTVQFVYPLATPLTFHVDPQEILSLVGENVVWSADGQVTVKT